MPRMTSISQRLAVAGALFLALTGTCVAETTLEVMTAPKAVEFPMICLNDRALTPVRHAWE